MSTLNSDIVALHEEGHSMKSIQARIYVGDTYISKLTKGLKRKGRRFPAHPLGAEQILLGARVQAWREGQEISKTDFAERVRTTAMNLALIEKGHADIPLSLLVRLSNEMNIAVGELICP